MMVLHYKGKYDLATFIKPFSGVVAATIVWDGMTCHSIMMKGTQMRAIGCITGMEVFNEIIDSYIPMYEIDNKKVLSEVGKIQILRTIGVAIVKQSVHEHNPHHSVIA